MPFQKGRKKTGGREKGSTKEALAARAEAKLKKHGKFIDQLQAHGFNFVAEYVAGIKKLSPEDKFTELRRLLPFMVPKLREKEVDTTDPAEQSVTESNISTADLIEAFGNGTTEKEANPGAGSAAPVAKGSAGVQVPEPASPSADLHDVDKEQSEE